MIESVLAKFTCSSVISQGESKVANLYAVYGTEEENKDFTKATPFGQLSIGIAEDVPASEFFTQGKNYYLTFTEVIK